MYAPPIDTGGYGAPLTTATDSYSRLYAEVAGEGEDTHNMPSIKTSNHHPAGTDTDAAHESYNNTDNDNECESYNNTGAGIAGVAGGGGRASVVVNGFAVPRSASYLADLETCA